MWLRRRDGNPEAGAAGPPRRRAVAAPLMHRARPARPPARLLWFSSKRSVGTTAFVEAPSSTLIVV